MLFIFRQLRRSFFLPGKLRTYAAYAVGEILLIVVGILIAVQISDWNEDRKAQVELDNYIVQLREDVGRAVVNARNLAENHRGRAPRIKEIIAYLEEPKSEPEALRAFEANLVDFGKYGELQIHVGLLGRLLNGNIEVIKRDQELAREAMEMEIYIEQRLSTLIHITEQVHNKSDIADRFRARPNQLGMNIRYDLEQLRSSSDFLYAVHNTASALSSGLPTNCDLIADRLEAFLAVLEEYK
jgi:hypothetical protein